MLDKISQPRQALHVSGDIPIHHRYTLGVAGERFFKAMRDDRQILTSPCPGCQERLLPPKMYCERCFEETSGEWAQLEGPGYVRSFTVLHRSLDGEELDIPEVAALIGWPAVRGGLIHRIKGIAPDEIYIGMAVEPVWLDQRTGAMADIGHFAPASDE